MIELTYKMTDRIDTVIDKIHDRNERLEDNILESKLKKSKIRYFKY